MDKEQKTATSTSEPHTIDVNIKDEMKIIRPAHNKVSFVVPNWKFMKYEAEQLREFIRKGKFEGVYDNAFSLSHAYVSPAPLNFFVINEDLTLPVGPENNRKMVKGMLKKAFGSWCIINPKIISVNQDSLASWKEACMAFPLYNPKRMERYDEIRAEYYIPFLWGWRKVKRKLTGIPAFIMQHEVEHCNGRNIYHGDRKPPQK